MRRWRLAWLALLVLAGCGRQPRLNLLLLTIDTCRADHFSCYGYDLLHTPNVDGLATEGVLFEAARTCVPITLPSHVSIMTGLYPSSHGVRENGMYKTPDSLLTLAEILKDEGYATAAFVGAFPVESRFNLDQGFDHYGDTFGEREGRGRAGAGGIAIFFNERSAKEVNAEFFQWLDERESQPFFVWLHYFEPHQPHEPQPPYDGLCVGRPYDAEIAFVDECVGMLREKLEEKGLLERTIVAVTSDHGEGLGEHNELTHALLLYDPTLRVPLIIRCPAGMDLSGRVTEPVRTVDLPPTLLELVGVKPPDFWEGKSLVDLVRGGVAPSDEHYYETFYGRLHFGWSVLMGYQAGGWKYLHGPSPELYHVAADLLEGEDLVAARPEVAAELREKLFSLLSTSASGGGAHAWFRGRDAETQQRLEALGYVGSWKEVGPQESWFVGPNPREMMDAHRWFNLARTYVHQGMWLQAIEAFRQAIETNPNSLDARTGLVQAFLQCGEKAAALGGAREAVELAPDKGEAWLLLARSLLLHRRFDEALQAATEALAKGADPVASWIVVGEASESTGDYEKAVSAYRHALGEDPSHFQSRLGLATCLARTGRNDEARGEFELGLRDNPYWAPAHYNYGVFLFEQRYVREAMVRFRRALKLSPKYVAAHHALAILLHEDGKDHDAVPHLEAVVRYTHDPARREAARSLMESITGRDAK
jgi:arylsulfatase A-like enzyme/Tfp pilus assembly protein PilF